MKKSTSNFLIGMLIGGAAGAIAGILYAPDKGSETRKKIKEKSGELKEDIEKTFEEIKSHIVKEKDDIRKGAEGTAKKTSGRPRGTTRKA
jgi:gas vesicle protein